MFWFCLVSAFINIVGLFVAMRIGAVVGVMGFSIGAVFNVIGAMSNYFRLPSKPNK